MVCGTSLGATDAPIARELRLRRGDCPPFIECRTHKDCMFSWDGRFSARDHIMVDSDFGHEFPTGQGRMARFFGEQVPLLAI